MRAFFDTNVLIAAVLEDHEHHERALAVVKRAISGKDQGLIAVHSLAEAYAVMTRLPIPLRVSPQIACSLIEDNFITHFECITLSAKDYQTILKQCAKRNIFGGTTYDAMLLACANKSRTKRLYTFNIRHFQALSMNEFKGDVVSP